MQKVFYTIIIIFLFQVHYVIAQTCIAVPVLTLSPGGTGPIGAHMMIAYNPLRNIYYSNSGGFGSNPIAAYNSTGGNTVGVAMGNQDWRGLWWNNNTNLLEGNCFSSAGIYTVALNQLTGYPSGGSAIVAPNSQPGSQVGGQYDPINNHVLYYNNAGGIAKYSRTTGLLVNTVNISGLPVPIVNLSTYGFYTGIPGHEYAVFDYVNRRAYYINYNTGAYVSSVQFPITAGAPSAFAISYANGLFFIYNNSEWIGYSAGLNAYSSPLTVCSGASTTLTAVSANNYSWSTGANTNSIVVSPTVTSVYSVIASPTLGCPNVMTLTVNIHPDPTLTISGNTIICSTGTNVMTASGAISYTWSNGNTTNTTALSPTISTTYSVAGTNSLGCISNKTVSILVDSNPTISISGQNTICNGESSTLTALGANTYSWNNGVISSSVVISPTTTTIYTTTGTNSNGCSSMKSETISVINAPPINITGTTSACSGANISLTASGASNYTWSNGSNNSSISETLTTSTSYSVIGTNTTNSCKAVAFQTVSIFPGPSISVSNTVICMGQTATLTASGAASYTWDNGAAGSVILDTPTITTIYTVSGTSTLGCIGSSTLNVIVSICNQIDETVLGDRTIKFKLYPNPNNGLFKISEESDELELIITIYDSMGKLVHTSNISNAKESCDLSDLSNGLYFISVKRNQKLLYSDKFIKQ